MRKRVFCFSTSVYWGNLPGEEKDALGPPLDSDLT